MTVESVTAAKVEKAWRRCCVVCGSEILEQWSLSTASGPVCSKDCARIHYLMVFVVDAIASLNKSED